jgi:hypothetical protein
MFAFGKIKLAGYKLSDRDRTIAAEDTIQQLRQYGQWNELDEEIKPTRTGDR